MTDFAHTGVSMLTKMFMILRLPVQSENVVFFSRVSTSRISGAWLPMAGRSPRVR